MAHYKLDKQQKEIMLKIAENYKRTNPGKRIKKAYNCKDMIELQFNTGLDYCFFDDHVSDNRFQKTGGSLFVRSEIIAKFIVWIQQNGNWKYNAYMQFNCVLVDIWKYPELVKE